MCVLMVFELVVIFNPYSNLYMTPPLINYKQKEVIIGSLAKVYNLNVYSVSNFYIYIINDNKILPQ